MQTLLIAAGLLWAAGVFAATVLWSPTQVRVGKGQNVSLAVAIDPEDIKAYTVKLEITYPADTLEVQSFTFANNWMPLLQKGYDLTDNAKGALIKTAGFPGGLRAEAPFGTIIFKAKKLGDARVLVTANSFALGSTNQNTMTGLPVTALASISETPVQQKKKEPSAEPLQNKPVLSPAENKSSPRAGVAEEIPPTQPSAPPHETSFVSELTAIIATPLSAKMIPLIAAFSAAAVAIVWLFLKKK